MTTERELLTQYLRAKRNKLPITAEQNKAGVAYFRDKSKKAQIAEILRHKEERLAALATNEAIKRYEAAMVRDCGLNQIERPQPKPQPQPQVQEGKPKKKKRAANVEVNPYGKLYSNPFKIHESLVDKSRI